MLAAREKLKVPTVHRGWHWRVNYGSNEAQRVIGWKDWHV